MLTVGGLFDGIGLLAYGLTLAGLEHRWLCELDPFRRQVLARRWPGVRIYDDVRAVGADAERVDVIAGGFPCKGASTAGKREGFGHPETRLWREMVRAIGELRPRFVIVENVANILVQRPAGGEPGELWAEVLWALASERYDVQWDCLPAAAFGAPHRRDRVVAVAADTDGTDEGRLSGLARQPHRWPHAGGGAEPTPADPESQHREARAAETGSLGRAASGGVAATADASGGRQPEQSKRNGRAPSRLAWASGDDALGRGIRVEWGEYEPAIRRWERAFGAAPEPLVRRVDDRRTMRVERSRLSALGDGVQVQLGEMVGRYLMELA